METGREDLPGDGYRIPAVVIRPPRPRGAAVIIHGYGGNKEEQLGLGWRVAEAGLAAFVIDLRGHGEHPLELDGAVASDLEAAIRSCRRFGNVVAIGHSLGGRLALLSTADHCIALSPSLSRKYGMQTQEMLRTLRSNRVRPPAIETLLAVQEALPVWEPGSSDALLLYAERDAPEIAGGCRDLLPAGARVLEIPGATHGDIFLRERAFAAVLEQVRAWYGA